MEASNSSLNRNAQRHSSQFNSISQHLSGRLQQQQEQQQLSLPSMMTNTRKKKHHGNRKLQRFKKKCLKRGMTKEQTQKLIDEYNHTSQGINKTIVRTKKIIVLTFLKL